MFQNNNNNFFVKKARAVYCRHRLKKAGFRLAEFIALHNHPFTDDMMIEFTETYLAGCALIPEEKYNNESYHFRVSTILDIKKALREKFTPAFFSAFVRDLSLLQPDQRYVFSHYLLPAFIKARGAHFQADDMTWLVQLSADIDMATYNFADNRLGSGGLPKIMKVMSHDFSREFYAQLVALLNKIPFQSRDRFTRDCLPQAITALGADFNVDCMPSFLPLAHILSFGDLDSKKKKAVCLFLQTACAAPHMLKKMIHNDIVDEALKIELAEWKNIIADMPEMAAICTILKKMDKNFWGQFNAIDNIPERVGAMMMAALIIIDTCSYNRCHVIGRGLWWDDFFSSINKLLDKSRDDVFQDAAKNMGDLKKLIPLFSNFTRSHDYLGAVGDGLCLPLLLFSKMQQTGVSYDVAVEQMAAQYSDWDQLQQGLVQSASALFNTLAQRYEGNAMWHQQERTVATTMRQWPALPVPDPVAFKEKNKMMGQLVIVPLSDTQSLVDESARLDHCVGRSNVYVHACTDGYNQQFGHLVSVRVRCVDARAAQAHAAAMGLHSEQVNDHEIYLSTVQFVEQCDENGQRYFSVLQNYGWDNGDASPQVTRFVNDYTRALNKGRLDINWIEIDAVRQRFKVTSMADRIKKSVGFDHSDESLAEHVTALLKHGTLARTLPDRVRKRLLKDIATGAAGPVKPAGVAP